MTAADDRGHPAESFLYLSARVSDVARHGAGAHSLDAGAEAPARQFQDGGSGTRSVHARNAHATACASTAAGLDRWRDGDIARAAALLYVSYTGDDAVAFAPHGEPDEWLRYVTILVEDIQCGRFDPGLTRVLRDGNGLHALALVTSVAPGTIHVAQLAVHPDRRRQGLASWLLAEIATAAGAAGRREITLLVRESNHGARRLYAMLGFSV